MYRKPHIVNCEKEEYHKMTAESQVILTVTHFPFFSSLHTVSIITLKNYTSGQPVTVLSINQNNGTVTFAGQSINSEMLVSYKWGTGFTFTYNPQNTSIEPREEGTRYDIIDGSRSYDGLTIKHDITISGENMIDAQRTSLEKAKQGMRLQYYTHEDGNTYIMKITRLSMRKKQGTGKDAYVYDYELGMEEV